jgi:hypothetical protein
VSNGNLCATARAAISLILLGIWLGIRTLNVRFRDPAFVNEHDGQQGLDPSSPEVTAEARQTSLADIEGLTSSWAAAAAYFDPGDSRFIRKQPLNACADKFVPFPVPISVKRQ